MGASGSIDPRATRGTRRVAVLVIDLITDFGFGHGRQLRDAVQARQPSITRLLARARAAAVPVIYVNDAGRPWRSDLPALLTRAAASPLALPDFATQLAPRDEDQVVLKPRHSAFFGTPLQPLLEDLRTEVLVLCGVSAESCIWITACDAFTRGYRLVVPQDVVAGISAAAVRATLTGLRESLSARVPARAASLRLVRGCLH
jgi:nicotinamidase-related amidase